MFLAWRHEFFSSRNLDSIASTSITEKIVFLLHIPSPISAFPLAAAYRICHKLFPILVSFINIVSYGFMSSTLTEASKSLLHKWSYSVKQLLYDYEYESLQEYKSEEYLG